MTDEELTQLLRDAHSINKALRLSAEYALSRLDREETARAEEILTDLSRRKSKVAASLILLCSLLFPALLGSLLWLPKPLGAVVFLGGISLMATCAFLACNFKAILLSSQSRADVREQPGSSEARPDNRLRDEFAHSPWIGFNLDSSLCEQLPHLGPDQ